MPGTAAGWSATHRPARKGTAGWQNTPYLSFGPKGRGKGEEAEGARGPAAPDATSSLSTIPSSIARAAIPRAERISTDFSGSPRRGEELEFIEIADEILAPVLPVP